MIAAALIIRSGLQPDCFLKLIKVVGITAFVHLHWSFLKQETQLIFYNARLSFGLPVVPNILFLNSDN